MSTMLPTARPDRTVGHFLNLMKSTHSLPPASSRSYDVLVQAPKPNVYRSNSVDNGRARRSERLLALQEKTRRARSMTFEIDALRRFLQGRHARQQYSPTLTIPTHGPIVRSTWAAWQSRGKRGPWIGHLDSGRRQLHVSPVQSAQPQLIQKHDRAVQLDAAAELPLTEGMLKRRVFEPIEKGSHRVSINRAGNKYFTPEEDATILDMRATGHSYAIIAERTGRTARSLMVRMARLRSDESPNSHTKDRCPAHHGFNTFHRYTSEEEAKIRELKAAGQSVAEIAGAIGRSADAVQGKLALLRGPKSVTNMRWSLGTFNTKIWTQEDDANLCEMMNAQQSIHTIANTLRRSTQSVGSRVVALRGDGGSKKIADGTRWTSADQARLLNLRRMGASWHHLVNQFPGRNSASLQRKYYESVNKERDQASGISSTPQLWSDIDSANLMQWRNVDKITFKVIAIRLQREHTLWKPSTANCQRRQGRLQLW